jgi:hypothetical protein
LYDAARQFLLGRAFLALWKAGNIKCGMAVNIGDMPNSARNYEPDEDFRRRMIMTQRAISNTDRRIDEVISLCNDDARGTVKALLLVNEQLENELQTSTSNSRRRCSPDRRTEPRR